MQESPKNYIETLAPQWSDPLFDIVSESRALNMIITPNSNIENFTIDEELSSDTWETRKPAAHISGTYEREGLSYKANIDLIGPGFLTRAIAKARGREPKVYVVSKLKPLIDQPELS